MSDNQGDIPMEETNEKPATGLIYYEECVPFTETDWAKAMAVFERRRLLRGEWRVESEEHKQLREIAESYHKRCDVYDQSMCSGRSPRTGEPMPVGPREMGLVNRHARKVLLDVVTAGEEKGFTSEQVWEAIRKYTREKS